MRIFMNILGVLLTLTGLVWILQGINILQGSMMTGQLIYALLGLVVGAIGVFLLVRANRRREITSGSDDTNEDR
jgi:multisubunit Na+/H+ antiporter MnhG subunit